MKKLLAALSIIAISAVSHAEVNVVNQVQITGATTDTTINAEISGIGIDLDVRDTGQAVSGSVIINSSSALTDFSVVNEVNMSAAGGNAVSGSVLITQ